MAYYRRALALAHHRGFGFHADLCAPGILRLLEPVRARDGLVVELGCGSGHLTRHLVAAGHRVLATDASPAMVDLARAEVPGAEGHAVLVLPDDPVPDADAVVSVGHVLSYLDDRAALERALVAAARSVRPGGLLALDVCDLEWGATRRGDRPAGWSGDDWALVTRFSVPAPDRFVREMTVFTRTDDGSWQRDDERHDNVLVDTAALGDVLAAEGMEVTVASSFGDEALPVGLRTVVAHRPLGAPAP